MLYSEFYGKHPLGKMPKILPEENACGWVAKLLEGNMVLVCTGLNTCSQGYRSLWDRGTCACNIYEGGRPW